MTVAERIEAYLQAWVTGDVSSLLAQFADSFLFDDPNVGRITRPGFKTYMEGIMANVERVRDGRKCENFVELSEIVSKHEDDGTATLWYWWAIAGTTIEGSSLVKIGPEGVRSEIYCYYARTAE